MRRGRWVVGEVYSFALVCISLQEISRNCVPKNSNMRSDLNESLSICTCHFLTCSSNVCLRHQKPGVLGRVGARRLFLQAAKRGLNVAIIAGDKLPIGVLEGAAGVPATRSSLHDCAFVLDRLLQHWPNFFPLIQPAQQ